MAYVSITSQKDLFKLTKANTVYHIKSEINLQGKTLKNPSGSLLFFDGGSFSPHRGFPTVNRVLSNLDSNGIIVRSVFFKNCEMSLDKYRLLRCFDTDISFIDCKYVSSYDVLMNGKPENPNGVIVSNMTNRKNKPVVRNSILKDK